MRWRGRRGVIAVALCLVGLPALIDTARADPFALRIGVYHNPPKVLEAGDGLSGIFGDVINAVAQREGWQLEPVSCVWHECLEQLAEGELDLLPDTALSQSRERDLQFHEVPVLRSWSQLYSDRRYDITSLLDLEGLRIAVVRDSVQQQYLSQLMDSFALRVDWLPVSSFESGFDAVQSGRADVVAANNFYGDLRARELKLHVTPVIFQPAALYVAARPGLDPRVLSTLDEYLRDWQGTPGSPWYQAMEHWGVFAEEFPLPTSLYWLAGLSSAGGYPRLAGGRPAAAAPSTDPEPSRPE